MSKGVRLCQWKVHKPPVHGIILYQRHLDTGISHNLWFGFVNTVESVLRTAFLLSESVHLTVLDLGMCRRPEYNEMSLKFLCFKELRDQYRMEQMYVAQKGIRSWCFYFLGDWLLGRGLLLKMWSVFSLKAMLMNFAIGHIFVK